MPGVLVVRVATLPCDGGQCGGDITLVTDVNALAYAETDTYGDTRFSPHEAVGVIRHPHEIEVMCGARDVEGEETCTGGAVVTIAELASFPWSDAKQTFASSHLTPMDRP